MTFIKELLLNEAAIPYIFLGLAFLIIVFLIIQAFQSRKARLNLMKDLVKTQETIFSNAAELLSNKLTEYTNSTLVNKVNENYERLTRQELLPAVNDMAKVLSELSEKVVTRQESGMTELAENLSELLASKTRDYIREEADVISSLHQTTIEFSDKLLGINDSISALNSGYNALSNQSNVVTTTVSDAVGLLGVKMTDLGVLLDNTSKTFEKMHDNIQKSGEVASALSEAAVVIHNTANDSAISLASQNEKTAELLRDAVHSMQQNTELSSKAVLSEFGTILGNTNTSIENTVSKLYDIAENISKSSSQFAESISAIYNQFSNSANDNLSHISKTIADSAEQEYQKIVSSAENYSSTFSDSVAKLNEALEGHILNLQTITRHLDNSVSSFKDDVNSSSGRFELGMEKSVSDALKEMDQALAEIIKRLVSVTVSIGEAADALPKAVKSIKDSN